jgi:hypothetical protein
MASQLESLRTDLNSIATNAQRAIEIDTRTFLRQNKSWFETRAYSGASGHLNRSIRPHLFSGCAA